jgi:hypothetical protein
MIKHLAARTWLEKGRALPLSEAASDSVDDYVNALPWLGTTGLDWTRMPPSRTLKLSGASPEDIYAWVKNTRAGHRMEIAIWYSRREGGIIVPMPEAAKNIDEFYWDAPGPRFVFGVDLMTDGAPAVFHEEIIQYGYEDLLVATV